MDLGEGPKTYYRDTNTMPNWAGSCWYYMRYLDPTDTEHMVEKDEYDYWMGPDRGNGRSGGVDLYVGGVEHAVLHLLYARFWHKVLFDLGYCGLGRAVPQAVQPGHDPGLRLHRRPRPVRAGRRGGGRPGRRRWRTDVHLERPACQPRVRQDGQEPEEHHHA